MEGKYKNGKIYKITDIGYNMCYIGSTIQPLAKRFGHHKETYHTGACASSVIFETYGKENCKITLIKEYPCENKDQLRAMEGYYIETMDCVNKFIAGGKKSDWDKRYYQKNKDEHKERCKKYYENNKDKVKQQVASYCENNKEQVNERRKEYRKKNQDILRAKQSEKILCECGCYSVRSSIARHRQSEKHIRLMSAKG